MDGFVTGYTEDPQIVRAVVAGIKIYMMDL
jgi:hypothetical protein